MLHAYESVAAIVDERRSKQSSLAKQGRFDWVQTPPHEHAFGVLAKPKPPRWPLAREGSASVAKNSVNVQKQAPVASTSRKHESVAEMSIDLAECVSVFGGVAVTAVSVEQRQAHQKNAVEMYDA